MSLEDVTVHVGRDATDSLEASASTVDTSGSFTVAVRNHHTPVHVHCRLAGDLAAIATLERSNYFVEADEAIEIPVAVRSLEPGREVRGTLEMSTRYGATATTIDVRVATGSRSVDVDDSLAEPRREEPEPTPVESFAERVGLEPATLAVFALAILAVLVAVGTAAVVASSTAAFVGVLAVGVGVLVATWILLR